MKLLLTFIFVAVFFSTASAQSEQEEVVLSSKLTKGQQMVKQEFPNVPQEVRDCHARGTFSVRIKVDAEGNVKSAKLINGLCKDANEYVEETIASWKFKVLKIDGKPTPFRSIVQISFCYGFFGACDW